MSNLGFIIQHQMCYNQLFITSIMDQYSAAEPDNMSEAESQASHSFSISSALIGWDVYPPAICPPTPSSLHSSSENSSALSAVSDSKDEDNTVAYWLSIVRKENGNNKAQFSHIEDKDDTGKDIAESTDELEDPNMHEDIIEPLPDVFRFTRLLASVQETEIPMHLQDEIQNVIHLVKLAQKSQTI
ncbi:hypothetical protein K439DRAFT_1615735 [Ramaria rubella]|nr:hypothetical protein K439DRAFT_1615735 [Ramaria rubella]